jgi:hypothetical protein
MTRRLLLFALLALPMLAADITGAWSAEVQSSAGTGSPKFVFEQKGETLTGNYTGQLGEAPLKGSVKGTAVQFQFEVQGFTVEYKGELENEKAMKGTVKFGDQATGTWTAKKT